jgi:hypothetical protein
MKSNNSSYEETSTDDYNSFENEEFDEDDLSAALEYTSDTNLPSKSSSSSAQMSHMASAANPTTSSRKRLSGRSENFRGAVRKRKCRTTFTKNQLNILEQEFLKYNFISNDKVDALVDMTGLDAQIIKVTFFFLVKLESKLSITF